MIVALARWFDANKSRLDDLGIKSAYTEGPEQRLQRSAWIDMDGGGLMCRVIVWGGAECDIDCVAIKSGQPITEHRKLRSEADLVDTLTKVIARLG